MISLCGFSQKENVITVKGVVIDIYEKPISNVNISIVGSSKGAKTDLNGVFYLKIKQEATTLKVSHISYYTKNRMLTERVLNDTLNLNIQLTQKVNQLNTFEITEEKNKLVFNKKFTPIYDYEFYEDKLLLLVRELNVTKLRLISADHKVIIEKEMPKNCRNVFKDCFGNIHITSIDSAYQLKINLLKIDLIYTVNKAKFNSYLKPCVTEFNNKFIFKQQSQFNQSTVYYYIDENRKVTYIRGVRNKGAIRNLSTRNAYAKQLEDPYISKMGGSRASVYSARTLINNINFLDNILNHSEDIPLFVIDNTVYIFDHVNGSCWIYDENLDFQKNISINYQNQKKWRKELIIDEVRGEVYAKFEKEGLCYLKKDRFDYRRNC